MRTVTSPPATSTARTMSSSVTGRRSSGSMTFPSAAWIASREGSTALRVSVCSEDTRVTWAGFVWRNLGRRRARTLLTSAGVALGVALIVALLAIAAGVRRTANDLIHVGRADFGIFQEGAADLTRSLLPDRLAARIRHEPGVASDARIFLRVSKVGHESSFLVFGLDPSEFPARRLVIVTGQRPRGDEALLGDHAAKSLHLRPGQTLPVEHKRFRIAGIYHSGDR